MKLTKIGAAVIALRNAITEELGGSQGLLEIKLAPETFDAFVCEKYYDRTQNASPLKPTDIYTQTIAGVLVSPKVDK